MRRWAHTVNCGCCQLRLVASAVVARNVPPAVYAAKLGVPVTRAEVAQAFKVPVEVLEKLQRPAEVLFAEVDLARARFAPLIATLGAEEDVTKIAAEVRAAKNSGGANSAAVSALVSAAKDRFRNTAFKSVRELLTFYEEVMFPARAAYEEFRAHQLNSFHIKDDLKRGLSAFKQDYLDRQKQDLVKVQKKMQECQALIKNVGYSAFDTVIFNDIANILRICGERNRYAHRKAMQVLEDMNLVGVPFNEVTMKLLHAIVFDDGALDDSALMFTLFEYPERGEVSVSKKVVEEIADDTLRVISGRHQTPLDDGKMLRQTDTQPCLQRSLD